MAVWAAFFGIFYGFLYFLGRRMGWWAVLPGLAGGVAMILALLQADRLLTIRREAAWQQVGIALTIVVVLAAMVSVTWFAAVSD
jgi:membrane associated rhomboid family serine protease